MHVLPPKNRGLFVVLAFFMSFALAPLSKAELLRFSAAPVFTLRYNDLDVPIYGEATPAPGVASEFASGKKMSLTGAGLREKRILFLNFNAYVAASYIDSRELLNENDPMASFRESKTRAMQLTFLRDVGAGDIREAFQETLEANGVDIQTPFMKDLFKKLNFDMHRGGVMQLLAFRKAGREDRLFFETPAGSLTQEGNGLADLFWKCWFGIPSDDGMAALKKSLLRVVVPKKG